MEIDLPGSVVDFINDGNLEFDNTACNDYDVAIRPLVDYMKRAAQTFIDGVEVEDTEGACQMLGAAKEIMDEVERLESIFERGRAL